MVGPTTKSFVIFQLASDQLLSNCVIFFCDSELLRPYRGTLPNWDHTAPAPCDGPPGVAWRALEILIVFSTASKRKGTCPMKVTSVSKLQPSRDVVTY